MAEAAIEADREIKQLIERAAASHKFEFEAVEAALRAAMLSAGAKAFGGLLEGLGCGRDENPVKCCCGVIRQSKGIEEKTLLTIMGPVPYRRSRYECPVIFRRLFYAELLTPDLYRDLWAHLRA